MLFFLLKITVPPILVAVMSLAARRWGPTVGGLLMGLPWMTGPVLFFLALDKGGDFAVAACAGIQLGVICIYAFILAYAPTSFVAPWPVCLLAATIAFGAVAWLVQGQPILLVTAAAAASYYRIAPRRYRSRRFRFDRVRETHRRNWAPSRKCETARQDQ